MKTPASLVMARAPRRGEVRKALAPMLGPEGCAALQTALINETVAWAKSVSPGSTYLAHDPPDTAPAFRAVLGGDVVLFPQNGEGIAGRVADAAARVFSRHDGPLLIVWPDLPRLRPEHARLALEDLDHGVDVVFGPRVDGGLYLIAIARPQPRLFALPEEAWRSPDVMSVGIAAARDAGLEIGILRVERALHRPADIRAALVDPLLADIVRQLLGRSSPALSSLRSERPG